MYVIESIDLIEADILKGLFMSLSCSMVRTHAYAICVLHIYAYCHRMNGAAYVGVLLCKIGIHSYKC